MILFKLDKSYICPLGESFMHRLKLSIMLATLVQLEAEILVISKDTPLFFGDFSLHSNVYINILE